ncbi:XdhC family protein [Paracoccus siganidrum]|uniref:XdhC family protein n=1 Tax=Paracoccus siganidrum TaxID=1276757 RepID=A0A419A7Y3_9RHOB|nr:XdhC family protein [Paracoccus siganidrum]RJL16587.1 XdhC family protein [Paracoccus siganidrum]RMC34542.1 XdhC family protein [Paracoccus siganidrum]
MTQDLKTPARPDARHPALADPWEAALASGPGTVMAVLTQTHGPAYRIPGAAMSIAADGSFAGALTSGCIEADLILNAQRVRDGGAPLRLRYGEGSPFLDLRLPCGGGIEVMLFPIRDFDVLAALSRARAARRPATLILSETGRLSLGGGGETPADGFPIAFKPPIRFVIFGAGPEAAVFADLVQSLGYDHVLLSHEEQGLSAAERMGCNVRRLDRLPDFAELVPDDRCAALLFYHDHDYEPEILRHLLARPAFYIGAQGSRATQASRLRQLAEMGVAPELRERVRGPIGLIPSSRDPKLLAISVLAEVVMMAGDQVLVPAVA